MNKEAIHTMLGKETTSEVISQSRVLRRQEALKLLIDNKAVSEFKLHFLETLFISSGTSKSMYYTDKHWRLIEKSMVNIGIEKLVKFFSVWSSVTSDV